MTGPYVYFPIYFILLIGESENLKVFGGKRDQYYYLDLHAE